jgi:hypothetical protein
VQVGSAIFSFDFVSADLWELPLHKGFTERLRLQKSPCAWPAYVGKIIERVTPDTTTGDFGSWEFGNTLHFEEVKRARTAAQDDRRKLTQKLRAKQRVREQDRAGQRSCTVLQVRYDELTRRALCLLTSPMQKRMQCRIV